MKVGLGAGIGLGVPLLALSIYLAVSRIRKHRKDSAFKPTATPMVVAGNSVKMNKSMSPKEMSGLEQFRYARKYCEEDPPYQSSVLAELPVDRPARQ